MKKNLATLLCGLIFGAGLSVSGMVNPMKVLAFLDIGKIASNAWDPTLAFVMGGGLVVAAIGYRFVFARGRPVFDTSFYLPTVTAINARLIAGSAIFGLGWGMTGFCPGPGVASLVFGHVESLIFVATMALGALAAKMAMPEN
jgi:uncharacterized membrane protein YedE/YeeE